MHEIIFPTTDCLLAHEGVRREQARERRPAQHSHPTLQVGRGHVSVSPGFEQGCNKGRGWFMKSRITGCSATAQGTYSVRGPQPAPPRARVCWQAGYSAVLPTALIWSRGCPRLLRPAPIKPLCHCQPWTLRGTKTKEREGVDMEDCCWKGHMWYKWAILCRNILNFTGGNELNEVESMAWTGDLL